MNPKNLISNMIGQGCIKCPYNGSCPTAFTERASYCCMYGYDPITEVKRYLRESIQALQEYCDGQDSCKECVFRDCRDGYDCKIYELINDERYEEAVK